MEKLFKLAELWKSIRPKYINRVSWFMIATGVTGASVPIWLPYVTPALNYFIEINSGHSEYINTDSYFFELLVVLGFFLVLLDRVLEHFAAKDNSQPLFDSDDSSIEIIGGNIKSKRPLSKLRNKSTFKMEGTEVDDDQ